MTEQAGDAFVKHLIIENCGQCEYCTEENESLMRFFYCGLTKLVVPQHTTRETQEFHRVPLECPRPDNEVMKQEEKKS